MTLEELGAVASRHRRVLEQAAELGELRAISAWRAKEAGASYGELAAVLDMARANVVPLVRRGQALSAGG